MWHPRSSNILGVQGLPWRGLEMICLTGLCHAEEKCETLHRTKSWLGGHWHFQAFLID